MCAKWFEKSENRVQFLVKKLESHKICDASGKLTGWNAFGHNDYLTVIESYLIFDDQIPEAERYTILNKAVNASVEEGKLNANGLLGNISKEENFYLNKPKKNFVLASSISIKFFPELKENNRNILFDCFLPKRFNRKKAKQEWELFKMGEFPVNYTYVRTSVKARSELEAYKIAIDKIDLLRGIWNLWLSREVMTWGSSSDGRTKPINQITLGPFQTLHSPSGKSATSTFWYEPDYIENKTDISREWIKIKSFEQITKKRLSNHLYKSEVEDAIRRYTRALDYRDLHISFLELWIVLEKLTATTNAQYEKMVDRVAFLYTDVDLHKHIMQHLRLYRNSNVHSGQRSEQIEKYVYQLKRYVDQLLLFNIENFFKFISLEEVARFLDLSTDSNLLKERVKLLNKAVKFRR
jgi:hypothetical protein